MTRFSNQTKFSILKLFPLRWQVSGDFYGDFRIKYKFLKGYVVEQNNQKLLEMFWSIKYKGQKIGSFPKFMYLVFKGYTGKYQSDHGIYSIHELEKRTLSLMRDNNEVGIIDFENSLKEIKLNNDGSIPFEHQFVIAFHIWKLIRS